MGDLNLSRLLQERGIRDGRVLAAIAALDRRDFVPEDCRGEAGQDAPLPIGHGQTISQPYVVGFMSQALGLTGRERVLEIGTGSGYQAAVLSYLAAEVYSVEIVPALHARTAPLLARLGLGNVHTRLGDGFSGWPEAAPFDAVVLTAAPTRIPRPLLEQLKVGGRLLAPVGAQGGNQTLVLVEKVAVGPDGDWDVRVRDLLPVRFVPMTGAAEAGLPG
jgi:protein-L-isoaspartate(D-aspartate) O-methyltransferase